MSTQQDQQPEEKGQEQSPESTGQPRQKQQETTDKPGVADDPHRGITGTIPQNQLQQPEPQKDGATEQEEKGKEAEAGKPEQAPAREKKEIPEQAPAGPQPEQEPSENSGDQPDQAPAKEQKEQQEPDEKAQPEINSDDAHAGTADTPSQHKKLDPEGERNNDENASTEGIP